MNVLLNILIAGKEFLKSLPAIVSMLMELKRLWDAFLTTHERRKKMLELKDAIREAREKKDTTRLEELVRSISSK